MSKIILNNIKTNCTTDSFNISKSDPKDVIIQVAGNFGGATVTLQVAISGMDFQDLDGFNIKVPSIGTQFSFQSFQ